eukprot:CAMPEP_0184010940 /NCGR_PEP_ID=MMETSP0954-20121128/3528_1 /TAXON_ID=627963 /ORGANISM="Aplanochytrium sp, Strain PBS07" /LENGTH=183 /DNA_ID=CAMNT_0026290657 /DNA_START=65 /DNA_END=616 /DNA_ORIENTATION=-
MEIDIAVVGPDGVGKSTLVEFRGFQEFGCRAYRSFFMPVEVNKQKGIVSLRDFLWPPTSPMMRSLLNDVDAILLCFSPDVSHSFSTMMLVWMPIIRNYASGVPIIVVCCKNDKKNEAGLSFIEEDIASEVVGSHPDETNPDKVAKIYDYLECSCVSQSGVETVYSRATELGMAYRLNRIHSLF